MANSRILVISSGILRRYFGVGAFLKFSYYLFHLPINQLWDHLLRILIKGYNCLEKDLKARSV